jgi:hypothetical protein
MYTVYFGWRICPLKTFYSYVEHIYKPNIEIYYLIFQIKRNKTFGYFYINSHSILTEYS